MRGAIYLHSLWSEWYGAFTVLLGIEGVVPRFAKGAANGATIFTSVYAQLDELNENLPPSGVGAKVVEAVKAKRAGQDTLASEIMFNYVDQDWYDEHHERVAHA